jgi:hypothetical protein
MRSSQALDSGVERFAEKHKAISPQRHRGHREAGKEKDKEDSGAYATTAFSAFIFSA